MPSLFIVINCIELTLLNRYRLNTLWCGLGDHSYATCFVSSLLQRLLLLNTDQFSRLFFNILHPPLNVPALGILLLQFTWMITYTHNHLPSCIIGRRRGYQQRACWSWVLQCHRRAVWHGVSLLSLFQKHIILTNFTGLTI